jgi:hypothetical protein
MRHTVGRCLEEQDAEWPTREYLLLLNVAIHRDESVEAPARAL